MSSATRTRLVLLLSLLLVFISTVSASTSVLITDDKTFTPNARAENSRLLQARAGTTLCYPFRISLTTSSSSDPNNNATIIPKTCYCQVTGTLTSDSASFLDSALASGGSANQTAFTEYLSTNGYSRAQGIANIKSSIQSALNAKTTTCVYPAYAIPSSCDACTYGCASGYKACGTTCIATSSTCKSGTTTKRKLSKKVCPLGYSACATQYSGARGGDGWECVNVAADLESCGGCQFPLADGVAGVDCTAIPGASMIGCIQGQCIVSTCMNGWTLKGNSCVRTAGRRSAKAVKRSHAKRA